MKTAVVLTGSTDEVAQQTMALNGFIASELSHCDEIEAWILFDKEIDLQALSFSALIKCVKMLRVKNAYVAECCLAAIAQLQEFNGPQLLLFGSNAFAAALSARLAQRFHGSSSAGVRKVQQEEGRFVIEKLVYSNNLAARFALKRMPYCISIARDFTDKQDVPVSLPQIENVVLSSSCEPDWIYSHRVEFVETEEALCSAKTVVAVGQGIGSKEKVALLQELTNLLGGKLGASRPVVMNAWLGMEHLIGASGAMIAPNLCIAIGVSGAAAFAVGIEKSKFIVAINKDEKAPIFKIANVGVCADYQEIVIELKKIISNTDLSE